MRNMQRRREVLERLPHLQPAPRLERIGNLAPKQMADSDLKEAVCGG
jgi:hypothetical protein